ncbi:unnamed protein product [Heterobilharzia americana]|nr:unnamed protein product [Heterobilharzia americana]
MTASYSGVKLSSINGHLICGLCGGYLIDATVLTECIHVFCRSCILKYLLENKICPLCQSLVQETRPGQALRPDVALQRIVYKLVPGLLKTEMKRISEFKIHIQKSHVLTSLSLAKRFCGGIQIQAVYVVMLLPVMSNEVVSYVEKYMFDFGVCKCCTIRLTNGHSCRSEEILNALQSQSYSNDYICKICFGLLHNPFLCNIPFNINEAQSKTQLIDEDYNKYALLYLCKKLNDSKYQFTAYQLRVTEPINIILREQFLWDELICLSVDYVDETTINNNNNNNNNNYTIENQKSLSPIMFTKNDINSLRSRTIPVKTVWKWIVEPHLSLLLKAPMIYSLRDDIELKSVKTNGLTANNPNHDQESNIICINLSRAFSFEFYPILPCSLQNSKIPRKRSRFNFAEKLKINSLKQETIKCQDELKDDREAKEVSMEDISYQNTDSSILNQSSSVINIDFTLPRSFQFSRVVLTELVSLLKDTCLHSNYIKNISENDRSLAFISSLNICRSVPLYLAGRYVKLSRRLPQTPWIIGLQRKLDSSVEELITHSILPKFGSNTQSCFVTAGREDVDVRCLGLGRPFVIEIISTVGFIEVGILVNSNTQDQVFIRDLQLVSSVSATAALKTGEMEKAKCYRAVCWCPHGGINTKLLTKMEQYTSLLSTSTEENPDLPQPTIHWPPNKSHSVKYGKLYFGPLEINQLTPIRVLHRRALMNRKRTIHHLCFMSYTEAMKANIFEFDDFRTWSELYPEDELFLLEIRCEAGTYIKELVHGDLGRCNPSLASIFGRQLDILALDVIAVELDWPKRLSNPT